MVAPKLPESFKGKILKGNEYVKGEVRAWTKDEEDFIWDLKYKGFTANEIAASCDRSLTSIKIKLKRLQKKKNLYNENHLHEKQMCNNMFITYVKPETVLDVYAGRESFYSGRHDLKVTSNDIQNDYNTDYHMDSFKFLCKMYCEGKTFDIVDLDPYGSAIECFDLAMKIARKGLIITLGEMGHKRFKRLDFVKRFYNIHTYEDFTSLNLVRELQRLAARHKKNLKIFALMDWQNISRAYFIIEPIKITEQWEG